MNKLGKMEYIQLVFAILEWFISCTVDDPSTEEEQEDKDCTFENLEVDHFDKTELYVDKDLP